MTDVNPTSIKAVELFLSVVGMLGNSLCCVLLFRNRLMPDKNLNLNALLNFTQSTLDFFSCIFYVLSLISYPRIHNPSAGTFVCSVLKSRALFWMTVTLRAGLNIVIAILNFIKLLYPFVSTSSNLVIFISSGMGLLLMIALVQLIPNMSSVSFDMNGERNCNHSAINNFQEVTGAVGMQRFFALFNFVYLYLFPLIVSMFMYKQVFHVLQNSDDESRKIAYREIMKSFFMDTVLHFLFFSIHIMGSFLSNFAEKIYYTPDIGLYRVGLASVLTYSVVYPYISIGTRRTYRKPFLDLLKSLGFIRQTVYYQQNSEGNQTSAARKNSKIFGFLEAVNQFSFKNKKSKTFSENDWN